ncbi:(d)CMP kinase [Desulfoscipio gibsoniae]|uniref:Cytidylate kinase n=1 Tax=Desulfoscipio gibsoniae DSM 7213 TaxID=767817 RepID=R4KN09_9FIRM|nr:(d)CMP kinase [Desulfoscipio gibsoniae]AGL01950.1 cytidylate kinase [Desulfoscipio gibsoniae DSM 7213]
MGRLVNIAIDGPAGAGKSTVAKLAAEKLGYVYIDTGAMYRAVTLQALMDKIDMSDETNLTRIAESVDLALRADESGNTRVFLNGVDVSRQIRTPEVSRNVSLVSQVPGVRRRMMQLQKEMGARSGVVMEGRDIGTQVLPDAEMKFFLTASVEERARRRYAELIHRGFTVTYDEVYKDIAQRDNIDSHRAVAPLKPARDAEIIDCTGMTVEQVVDAIAARVSGRSL